MVQHPLFGEVSKNFNETAALDAYEEFKSDPQYYHTLLQMHAHDVVSEVKYTHPEVVDELLVKKFEDRKELVQKSVLSGVINKSMSNKIVDSVVATMDKIQKDFYTEYERSTNTSKQRRDARGRFVPMGKTKIQNPTAKHNRDAEWNDMARSYDKITMTRHSDVKKVPTIKGKDNEGNKIRPEFNAKHSAAFLQVADALGEIDPGSLMLGSVKWEQRDEQGALIDRGTSDVIGSTPDEFVRASDYKKGRTVQSIDWYMDMDSARGGGYDLLTGAGMSGQTYFDATGMANRAVEDGKGVKGYNAALADPSNKNAEYGSAGYRKLNATATMIDEIGGDALSGEAKWALGAAKYVGEHGPEAEKVLGPTARRTAYRYRGVERKPDKQLDRSIAASVQNAKTIDDAREQLIHPSMSDNLAGDPRKPESARVEQDLEFSPFIRYWQAQLPKKENLQLHLDSGAIAPSQGIVFDAKGQVVTQAVGFGDDHYLPFNLKNLSRANRGEWVRTRTMGGPTTEDVYAALTTGTRSVTVVSHSGVYNVEFDESFRGGRRYNDKAARMVRRYSQLLDTLEAENTTLQDIPSDRLTEMNQKARLQYGGDSPAAVEARKEYVGRLKQAERADPKPAQERIDEWTEEYGNQIAEKYSEEYAKSRNFPDVVDWDQLKAQQSVKANRMLTDLETVEALGLSKKYNRFIEYKTNEYKSQQKPLKLNGQGYYFALQALQEQFPYYIKRVEWYPPNEPQSGKDQGYVKRNFLRSADIKEGFWDPEIEGHVGEIAIGNKEKSKATGKVQAHHTKYQNAANREAVKDDVDSKKYVPGRGGGGTANPNTPSVTPGATTTTATTTGGGSLLGSLPGSGVRLTRGGEPVLTQDSAMGLLAVGDTVSNMEVDVNGQRRKIGSLGAATGYPRTTNWEATKAAIEGGDEQALKDLDKEFNGIFVNTPDPAAGGNAGFESMLKSQVGPLYSEKVLTKKLLPPKTAVDSVSDAKKNQLWSLGSKFSPNQNFNDDGVVFRAMRDDDIRNFQDRAEQFASDSEFRNSVRAADEAIRKFRSGSSTASFRYGRTDYYPADVDTLAAQVANDTYGYLKWRQISRLAGAEGPFDGFTEPPKPEKKDDGFRTTGEKQADKDAKFEQYYRSRESQQAMADPPATEKIITGDTATRSAKSDSVKGEIDMSEFEDEFNKINKRYDGRKVSFKQVRSGNG